jgi:hypothetical protein
MVDHAPRRQSSRRPNTIRLLAEQKRANGRSPLKTRKRNHKGGDADGQPPAYM